MIVITGATGKLGSAIVESLLRKVPADQVGVSVRDESKAQGLAARGVRVRQGSFDDSASLAHAFEGADQVLIISTDAMGEGNVTACRTAVKAAVDAGAKRVLYTSQMGSNPNSHFQACVDHAELEETLADCGTAWTSLRNGFYASSAILFAEQGMKSGDIALPADGPTAWTTHADLADAAAVILAGERTFDGPTPVLTANATATFEQIAQQASTIAGRTITRAVIDDDAFVAQLVGHGTPQVVAEQLLGIFRASRAGEFDHTDPTLGELIGREPQTVEVALREALQG